jgi:hypothetical protein
MIRFILRLFMLLIVLGSFSGCATILTGTHQNIEFESVPAGALVELKDPLAAQFFTPDKTPCTIAIPRWQTGTLTISAPGYETQSVKLRRHVNSYMLFDLPWFAFFIVPGIVAVCVDIGTGAIWELDTVVVVSSELQPKSKFTSNK